MNLKEWKYIKKMDFIKRGMDKHKTLFIAIFLLIVPVICVLLTLVADGVTLQSFRLPHATNDELVYYHQVDSVLKYGIPQGHFGYSETHANYLSFGAWSPVLLINYLILGVLFGWSAIKAVIYNIIMISVAMFLFGILAKPNVRQTLFIALFYAINTYITRNVLTVIPEVTCYFYVIVFIGLSYSCFRENRLWKRMFLLMIAILLSWMRPYYLLLFIVYAFFSYKQYKWKSLPASGIAILIGLFGYRFIFNNFCGKPSSTFIKSSWLDGFQYDFLHGVFHAMHSIFKGIRTYFLFVRSFFIEAQDGKNFFLLLVCIVIFVLLLFYCNENRSSDQYLWRFFWLLSLCAMIVAVSLFFPGEAADRHIAEFVIMSMFVIAMESGEKRTGVLLLGIALIFSAILVPIGRRNYATDIQIETVEDAKIQLAENMPLDYTGEASWNNTVDWIFIDGYEVDWKMLFALPSGYAVNLCFSDWFLQQETYQSRYVATINDGAVEARCVMLGGKKIADYGGIVIYRIK